MDGWMDGWMDVGKALHGNEWGGGVAFAPTKLSIFFFTKIERLSIKLC